MMSRLFALVSFLLVLLAGHAQAHEMSMAEMEVRQVSPTEFLWQWTASGNRPASEVLKPIWPDGCVAETNMLRCGEAGLQGTLAIEGVGQRYSAAMVKVFWLDGQSRVYTITAAQKSVRMYGSAEDGRGWGEIAQAYTVLGIEHILSGIDHLLFVIALLFLVGFNKKLLWTITAFTAAHSLTLALSALGILTLRVAPVEATIALSIVLVANEALNKEMSLSRRWPAMVAFLFGLVHGLGFAGALKEIGLPDNHLSVALVTFNLGVEIGQIFVVGAAFLLVRKLGKWPAFIAARTPVLYAIGGTAAFWTLGRVARVLG
jgi:hydrogenase/urease accessory protein HupE